MKMRKTDLGVVAFMYLVCAYFYSQTIQFKADSQTYPMFTIILLFALTTLYLLQMVVAAKKHGVESGVKEVFKDFQPAQFFVCLLGSILYVVLMHFFLFDLRAASKSSGAFCFTSISSKAWVNR